ncbi:unnamed protein product [Ranitomeya imitator]|uniref:Uncharacterized protein n=1 Tax=Ranitomeya imitator TaxID=111125 RepID=A0ABN9KVQ6_9NEOB|nr:unnamed protein product [Ranitomeya imitator]
MRSGPSVTSRSHDRDVTEGPGRTASLEPDRRLQRRGDRDVRGFIKSAAGKPAGQKGMCECGLRPVSHVQIIPVPEKTVPELSVSVCSRGKSVWHTCGSRVPPEDHTDRAGETALQSVTESPPLHLMSVVCSADVASVTHCVMSALLPVSELSSLCHQFSYSLRNFSAAATLLPVSELSSLCHQFGYSLLDVSAAASHSVTHCVMSALLPVALLPVSELSSLCHQFSYSLRDVSAADYNIHQEQLWRLSIGHRKESELKMPMNRIEFIYEPRKFRGRGNRGRGNFIGRGMKVQAFFEREKFLNKPMNGIVPMRRGHPPPPPGLMGFRGMPPPPRGRNMLPPPRGRFSHPRGFPNGRGFPAHPPPPGRGQRWPAPPGGRRF